MTLCKDKRVIVLSSGLLLLVASFWSLSRYPALDAKALMAGSLNLDDGLSFDAWITHSGSLSWLQTSLTTFLNWLHTNLLGMLFGLAFAILLMSLLTLIQSLLVSKSGAFRSSLLGMFIGTPLGVCVNCAAPIAFGMIQKGARVETALSAMLSSPTLNIIVLSMAFALFPVHVVAVKILLILLCLFVLIPWLARLFADEIHANAKLEKVEGNVTWPANSQITEQAVGHITGQRHEGWKNAWFWSLKEISKHSYYVVKQVLPLMLLAGLLGSIAVTLLPWQQLVEILPPMSGTIGLLALLLLAVFGLFLPVPMAFDIIVCAILLSAGVPVIYVATLLFVLGSFSIYSYLLLIKAGIKKMASCLALCLLLLGMLAGFLTHVLDQYYQAYLIEYHYTQLLADDAERHRVTAPQSEPALPAPALIWQDMQLHPEISMLPLSKSVYDDTQSWRMQRVKNSGLQTHPKTLIHHRIIPFNHTNSISSGDVNQDGWLDVVIGTSQGLFLYMNTGTGFALTSMPALAPMRMPMGAISLVDLNNDGWPDLLFNASRQGEYVAYNHQGVFQTAQLMHASKSVFALALAVGDIDHNRELDIIVGNNNGVGWLFQSPANSKNQMLLQHDGQFTVAELPSQAAETLSILLSDINQDSHLDMLIGNDFDEPDVFYWGDGQGQWKRWNKNTIAAMTDTTMSLDSADFNNDLRLDTYHAQITRNPASPPMLIQQKSLDELIQEQCREDSHSPACQELLSRQACLENGDMSIAQQLDRSYQLDCAAARIFLNGNRDGAEQFGGYLAKYYPDMDDLYAQVFSQPVSHMGGNDLISGSILTVKNANLLFMQMPGQGLREQSTELGVHIAGWAWHAKFADLDGDSWQDLFVVNGWSNQLFGTENVWFKNQSGQKFSNQSQQVGLDDFDATLSYTYLDYDNDGDLDIITFSAWGELKLYQNHNNSNHHIQIELDDRLGNRSGIGSQLVIHYGEEKKLHQLREIKASGGYLSLDAPVAHFGLGEYQAVDTIDVRWSTGEKQTFEGPFSTEARYRITRQ